MSGPPLPALDLQTGALHQWEWGRVLTCTVQGAPGAFADVTAAFLMFAHASVPPVPLQASYGVLASPLDLQVVIPRGLFAHYGTWRVQAAFDCKQLGEFRSDVLEFAVLESLGDSAPFQGQ